MDNCSVAFQGHFQSASKDTAVCIPFRMRESWHKNLSFLGIFVHTLSMLGRASYAFAQVSMLQKGSHGPHYVKQCSLTLSFSVPFLTLFFPSLLLSWHYAMYVFVYCLSFSQEGMHRWGENIILLTFLYFDPKAGLAHSRCSVKNC